MLAIVYWNVHKGRGKELPDAIVELAEAIASDPGLAGNAGEIAMCFSEAKKVNFDAILASLKARFPYRTWWKKKSLSGNFVCVGTIPETTLELSNEVNGSLPCTLIRTTGAMPQNYELWFAHLPAPIFVWQPGVLGLDAAREFRQAIEAREALMSNPLSLALGDFNMAPFSEPMVAPTGLNATGCEHVASSGYKSLTKKTKIQYFYNPMWPLLGSWSSSRQPGTFYATDKTIAQQWHLIDQVLVRPALISHICPNTPKIFTSAGPIPLTTTDGKIGVVSDHLPILISLSI